MADAPLEPVSLLRALLATLDLDAAAQFADEHPDVRTPTAVQVLVHAARAAEQMSDQGQADNYLTHAGLLCGAEWSDGPIVVATIADGIGALWAGSGEAVVLAVAVESARQAVAADLDRLVHPVLLPRVMDVASLLLDHAYETMGDEASIGDAVVAARRSVAATAPDDPGLAPRLGNLATRLASLYDATGGETIQEEAIAAARRAVAVVSPDSSDLPAHLSDLGTHLASRYTTTGEPGLLEEAVAVARRAVAATAEGDPGLPRHLNGLANRLVARYATTGDRATLEEVVVIARRAVAATPPAGGERPALLNNLALHLARLHAATGSRAVLEQAVAAARSAVEATPPASPDRPSYLNNLGNHLADAYAATGDRGRLDEAVTVARRAVATAPPGGAQLPGQLNNLASRLADLYDATGDSALLHEAVATARRAVEAAGPASTEHPGRINNLASHLAELSVATRDGGSLDEAWRLVAGLDGGGPAERMAIAHTRAGIARQRSDPARAVTELAMALHAFDDEVGRLRDRADLLGVRDLSQRLDGLLGDLATTRVVVHDIEGAVATLEDDRTWLRAPVPPVHDPVTSPGVAGSATWAAGETAGR